MSSSTDHPSSSHTYHIISRQGTAALPLSLEVAQRPSSVVSGPRGHMDHPTAGTLQPRCPRRRFYMGFTTRDISRPCHDATTPAARSSTFASCEYRMCTVCQSRFSSDIGQVSTPSPNAQPLHLFGDFQPAIPSRLTAYTVRLAIIQALAIAPLSISSCVKDRHQPRPVPAAVGREGIFPDAASMGQWRS